MSDVINRRDSPFLRIEMPLRGLLVSSFVAESVKIILKVCHNVKLGCRMCLPEYEDRDSWTLQFGK
jgi:hypothetical protein